MDRPPAREDNGGRRSMTTRGGVGRRRREHLSQLEGRDKGVEAEVARHGRVPSEKAEALGWTYEEYTLELLERGRYPQRGDTDRIDAIKRKRPL